MRPLYGIELSPGLSAILIDAQGGLVLEEHDADRRVAAAGVARLLAALVTLEQVRLGLFDIDAPVVVGTAAAAARLGLLRLDTTRTYPLDELMRAIFVAGATDATLALAEVVCASLPACVTMVNARAQRLGMAHTEIANMAPASEAEAGMTTVRDAALLVRALLDHQEAVRWSSLPGIPFDGGPVVLRNTNSLVGTVVGVDGMQVARLGSSCSVMATAQRRGSRVVAVVAGSARLDQCYDGAAKILEAGFRAFESVELVREGETLKVSVEVVGGTVDHVAPEATRSFSFFQRRGAPIAAGLTLRYQLPSRLAAPVERNAILGELVVERDGRVIAVIPARSPQRIGRSGLF